MRTRGLRIGMVILCLAGASVGCQESDVSAGELGDVLAGQGVTVVADRIRLEPVIAPLVVARKGSPLMVGVGVAAVQPGEVRAALLVSAVTGRAGG